MPTSTMLTALYMQACDFCVDKLCWRLHSLLSKHTTGPMSSIALAILSNFQRPI